MNETELRKVFMRAIGIRVSPKIIFYSIVEENEADITVVDVSKIVVPVSLTVPDKLRFIRTTILDIISEYEIVTAGIRVIEPSSQSRDIFRLNVEGVIQELLSSSTVEKYLCGQISNMARLLEFDERADFKKYVSAELQYGDIENWNKMKSEERESLLVALASLCLE
jgi:hypothetical protein